MRKVLLKMNELEKYNIIKELVDQHYDSINQLIYFKPHTECLKSAIEQNN